MKEIEVMPEPMTAPRAFFERPAPRKSPAQEFHEREVNLDRLTEVIGTDRSGRQISRFYGKSCWSDFAPPVRRIAAVLVPQVRNR
jgi:hypothetical protein